MTIKKELLGSYQVGFDSFGGLDGVFRAFRGAQFAKLSHRRRFDAVNKALLELILQAGEPCFLLRAVIEFLARVNSEKLLAEPCRFSHFEFWLNHYSQLSDEENRRVRCKICGKNVPRDEYQRFFPIGQNKMFDGSHFVAAHLSPDVDTAIASFWGWVDAFCCKVATGVHQWSLPGTVADAHTIHLFQNLFGKEVFDIVVRQTQALTLTALDLVTKRDLVKVASTSYSSDQPSHLNKAIILVDDQGNYLGDWRATDSEAVRQVVETNDRLIRWLENSIQAKLISVLAQKNVTLQKLKSGLDELLEQKIVSTAPASEFTEQQKYYQNGFLERVLGVKGGVNAKCSALLGKPKLALEPLFEATGNLVEDRGHIFRCLEKIFHALTETFQAKRDQVDRFEVLLKVKEEVLGIAPLSISVKSDVDEIRTKMDTLDHLTVVIPEENKARFAVGVVYAKDIQQSRLGTVSLRDFSNETETKMASYLEVISVIDHHKTDIKTSSAATIVVGDAQSANTIVAELVMQINERYSLLGMTPEKVRSLKPGNGDLASMQRLVQLKMNTQTAGQFWIHPKREYSEYLFFLNAIIDDTDLLTKISKRDLECVAKLLNRMKSLATGQDEEIISFAARALDDDFTNRAARLILQNDDMYSLYKEIFTFKEHAVKASLEAAIQNRPSNIFADTKVQNGCCRVGQTKLFSSTFGLFQEHADRLQTRWFSEIQKIYQATPQLDFHLQMISTIASADEVYKGLQGKWKHQDELWIWAAPTGAAQERLVSFLNAFQATKVVSQNPMEVEFLGPNGKELASLFSQNFAKAIQKMGPNPKKGLPIAIIRYKAGLINSRKGIITPCLPRQLA